MVIPADHPVAGEAGWGAERHDGLQRERSARLMVELTYEVTFKGVASPTLRAAFADHDLTSGSGVTWVRCPHGTLQEVFARIEELGLELLDVRLVAAHPAEHDAPTDP